MLIFFYELSISGVIFRLRILRVFLPIFLMIEIYNTYNFIYDVLVHNNI